VAHAVTVCNKHGKCSKLEPHAQGKTIAWTGRLASFTDHDGARSAIGCIVNSPQWDQCHSACTYVLTDIRQRLTSKASRHPPKETNPSMHSIAKSTKHKFQFYAHRNGKLLSSATSPPNTGFDSGLAAGVSHDVSSSAESIFNDGLLCT
jgi:hypothetical protein